MEEKKMELKEYVKIYDNTASPQIISSFIQYLNSVEFNKASVVHNEKKDGIIDENVRRTESFNFFKDKKSLTKTHWYNFWCSFFKEKLKEYSFELKLDTSSSMITSLEALKYKEGGFYNRHTDYHLKYPRNLSIIYFLNNDYEGGELNFSNPSNGNEIYLTVKPKCGRMILWPSNFLFPHKVTPVKKGLRYVLVSWIS